MAKSSSAVADESEVGKSPDDIASEFTNTEDDLDEGLETSAESTEESDELETSAEETTEAAASTEAETSAAPSIRDILRTNGFQSNADSDDGALAEFRQFQSVHLPQLQQQARFAQQVAPQWDDFQKWQASQQAAKPAAAPEPDEWTPPQYLPEWEHLLIRDENGEITGVKPGGDINLPQKIHAHQQWRSEHANKIVNDFRGMATKAVMPEVEKLVEQRIASKLHEIDQQRMVQNIVQQNRQEVYALDASGNIQTDQFGQPLFSQAGQQAIELLNMIPQRWSDPQFQYALVSKLVGLGQSAQQTAAAPVKPAGAVAAVKPPQKATATQRTAGIKQTSRAGTVAQPSNANRAAPQNAHLTRPESFLRNEWNELPANFGIGSEDE